MKLILKKKLYSFSQNYVIQEVLTQHDTLSSLNSSSVNPIRVMTLRLNGKIKYLHSIVRFGTPGSITDVTFKNGKEIIQASSITKNGVVSPLYYDVDGIVKKRDNCAEGKMLQIPNMVHMIGYTEFIKEIKEESVCIIRSYHMAVLS